MQGTSLRKKTFISTFRMFFTALKWGWWWWRLSRLKLRPFPAVCHKSVPEGTGNRGAHEGGRLQNRHSPFSHTWPGCAYQVWGYWFESGLRNPTSPGLHVRTSRVLPSGQEVAWNGGCSHCTSDTLDPLQCPGSWGEEDSLWCVTPWSSSPGCGLWGELV